jgi:hypothetical protein
MKKRFGVWSWVAMLGLLSLVGRVVQADTLTYKLAAHERACFYAIAKDKGEKIAVYYSVCPCDSRVFSSIKF